MNLTESEQLSKPNSTLKDFKMKDEKRKADQMQIIWNNV